MSDLDLVYVPLHPDEPLGELIGGRLLGPMQRSFAIRVTSSLHGLDGFLVRRSDGRTVAYPLRDIRWIDELVSRGLAERGRGR